jgi:hypothetical protein
VSNDGIVNLRLIVDVDVLRARFDERMHINLEVWDEIREEFIQVYPDSEQTPSDLTRPGEGCRGFRVEIRQED